MFHHPPIENNKNSLIRDVSKNKTFFLFSVYFLSIVECVSKPVAFLANRLQKALDRSAGLKPKTIVRIIVSRCEIDLADIKAEFERIANRKLLKAIEVR